jgi:phenylalanine-4-hydroxylase
VKVRKVREANQATQRAQELAEIHQRLESDFPDDWLLRLELLELDQTARLSAPWAGKVRASLQALSRKHPENRELIDRGLDLLR